MIIIEKTKHFNTEDLLDRVDSSLLNDNSKSILKKFISDVSIQNSEIYHQFSRQCLDIPSYNLLWKLNKSFAQMIFDCLSSESISVDYINKGTANLLNQLHFMLMNVKGQISGSTYQRLLAVEQQIKTICDKFIAKCQGIVVNNRNIYYDTNANIDDLVKPKHYKLNISDANTEEAVTKNTNNKSKIKHLDLDTLAAMGLKIKKY